MRAIERCLRCLLLFAAAAAAAAASGRYDSAYLRCCYKSYLRVYATLQHLMPLPPRHAAYAVMRLLMLRYAPRATPPRLLPMRCRDAMPIF